MLSMKPLFTQIVKFIFVSGTGWLIDLGIFLILTYYYGFQVWSANILGAVPAVTFVFFVSTRKIFSNNALKRSLKQKYCIYIAYQIVLVLLISFFGQFLYDVFYARCNVDILLKNMNLAVKILMTCITIVLNFIVMKLLVEKF